MIGTRSFGDDPILVGTLAAAVIEGIQSQGVAATIKHFPGHGDTQVDTHLGLSVLPTLWNGSDQSSCLPFSLPSKLVLGAL